MMKIISKSSCLIAIAAAAMLCALSVQAQEPVSIESLLKEMIDRDAVARYPESDFRLKQHSSYNRASKRPDEPKGWFKNKDYNSKPADQNFIRIEKHAGKQEWVLMDHAGPGAIVRTWMPWLKQDKPETTNRIRIYLDGATEPVLEGNMLELLDGSGLIPYPLAHASLRSAVSFFPIPYAQRCKITTTEQPFFYQFTFREYAKATPVKTFTMEDFEKAATLTEEVGKALLNPEKAHAGKTLVLSENLASKEEKALNLPADAAAVRNLTLRLGSYEDPAVTRSVILKMKFDGKETVWSPVGDFFGCGIGLHPFQGWYRTVSEEGAMSCRWVMPYQKNAEIAVLNLGDDAVDIQLEALVCQRPWDTRSMYFHAAWRGQYPVPTRPFSDWNYITIQGRGVYVGDSLTIMNPVEKWWGEGDEKIWVDGEDFPSIFGTGTEDYYAYSWGGRSTDFYEHPFHAQVRCNKYDKLTRKTIEERNTQGYSTETRTRALDTMPFHKSLQLDMEVWSWTDCDMAYGVGVYWYGDATSSSNREPDPQGAPILPPLPDIAAGSETQAGGAEASKGALEVEAAKVLSKAPHITMKQQNLKQYKALWSKGGQVLFTNTQPGDVVELRFSTTNSVAEKLTLHATKSWDYGVIRFSVNGHPVSGDIDGYAARPMASGPIDLGVFQPVNGGYTLRIEVIGKNSKSTGTGFGLDCLTLSAAE